ncbi:MAG: methyltransferase domain-containing protein [Myxococcales bacterium]|nr:methyltransferase domain-containing protein [Myxococcales bacterium]
MSWDPAQYEKFRAQRMEPFFDLVAWVRPRPGMKVIDLGCGTGELTALLAERLPGASVEGIDSSDEMLARAAPRASARVTFRRAGILEISDYAAYDLVFSHAAFQWVPDNERLMERILFGLKAGAQIAVQLPRNGDHPSHAIAHEVAAEEPFRAALGGFVGRSHALLLERYAELLHHHGLREQTCIEKIYGHELACTGDVVEWVKGTLLTPYLARLDEPGQAAFLAAYRARLIAVLGDRSPYFYPFRRLLFSGRKG